MPITETALADAPLSQGDILSDLRLFATKIAPGGGEAASVPNRFALVMSRPCVAVHKENITVAAIEKYKGSVPSDVKNFEDILGFLVDTRDALEAPDVFYIGQIPGFDGRFCARIDSLHCIQIPSDATARMDFLRKHRIAKLHPDFLRDLHLRLFRTFASLGFDDLSWFSTEDLEWLVSAGRADVASAEGDLQQKQVAKGRKEFEGGQFAMNEITKAAAKLSELKNRIAPYELELSRRKPDNPPTKAEA